MRFLRDPSFYPRTIDPLQGYKQQAAFYLHKVKNLPIEVALNRVHAAIEKRNDPTVVYFERPDQKDRVVTYTPLSQYLHTLNTQNLIRAPSMTAYVQETVCKSLISEVIDVKTQRRSALKKQAAKAKADGDSERFNVFSVQEQGQKRFSNSASGAFNSRGSAINNPSGHSSLTSMVRTMTSIGNAAIEAFVAGNRHYRSEAIALNHVVYLAHSAPKAAIRACIQNFGLHVPTGKEVLETLTQSTSQYWKNRSIDNPLTEFIRTLDEEERCNVVYSGSLYHLRCFNETLVRSIIDGFLCEADIEIPVVRDVLQNAPESLINYVRQVWKDHLLGIDKNYEGLDPCILLKIAQSVVQIQRTLDRYKTLFQCFFLTHAQPISIAYLPSMMRKSVVLSDTDSIVFSCDEWVVWYFGALTFSQKAFGVAGAIMFLGTECLAHQVALFSAKLNISERSLFRPSMKPEYVFPVFAGTESKKHYYASISIKEGLVYRKQETEIKGVHLRNPDAMKLMESVLHEVETTQKVSLTRILDHVVALEQRIVTEIQTGKAGYLNRLNIQPAEAYKGEAEISNYRYHLFWQAIFAPKYGNAPDPTYAALKIPVLLGNKTAVANWIGQLKDRSVAQRLIERWSEKFPTAVNTFYVPLDHVVTYGIPEELTFIMDSDSIIVQYTLPHRMLLESLGFFYKPKKPLHWHLGVTL